MLIPSAKETVLVIPDTQLPFDHVDSIEFLEKVKKKINPTRVVHIGDFFDLHALSLYTRNPDGRSAGDELALALKRAKDYYRLFPEAYMIAGNHDTRIYKRCAEAGIPRGYLKDYEEWLGAPKGWSVHEKIEIDKVLYIHGEGFSGINGHITAAIRHMQSVVMGHLHAHAGIGYFASHRALCFGMNVGCLIDVKSYAFEYGKHLPFKPILSCGIVDKGVPKLIPMLLNTKGRWVGKI